MLKLKLQYFGHLMWRADSFEKTLMWERLRAGGEGGDRGWDGWMASPTQCTWVWVNSGSWWWTGRPDVLQFIGSQRVGHNWATELSWRLVISPRSGNIRHKVRSHQVLNEWMEGWMNGEMGEFYLGREKSQDSSEVSNRWLWTRFWRTVIGDL